MNSKILRFGFLFVFCFVLTSSSSSLVLLDEGTRDEHKQKLLQDLQKATGLLLEMKKDSLRQTSNTFANFPFLVVNNEKFSSTARYLLLGALNSQEVYRVQTGGKAKLGKSGSRIDLNFDQLYAVSYRGVPRAAFGPGIIFLHELAHIHRGLIDPEFSESKTNPDVKGQTVEFINLIQRELGLPERLHYFPKKLTGRDDVFCIYFGPAARVELESSIFEG